MCRRSKSLNFGDSACGQGYSVVVAVPLLRPGSTARSLLYAMSRAGWESSIIRSHIDVCIHGLEENSEIYRNECIRSRSGSEE